MRTSRGNGVGYMKQFVIGALAAASVCGTSAPAYAAAQIFDFIVVDSGKGLGVTPGAFGSVTVTEDAGDLLFSYATGAGYRIHQGNGNHDAFNFSLAGTPVVAITGLPANFAREGGSGPFNEPPFGDFGYSITYSGNPNVPGKGYADGFGGTLTFRVDAGATALSLASLTSRSVNIGGNAYNVFFSSDIVDGDGDTANVGAVAHPVTVVPEPATWALMILGFGAVGAAMRRRGMALA